ncbi:MAG: hypothetical protein JWO05_3657 [Gemmatimonadetes bacterium]|nr:hypothetical protein [Gemmatimonadota bacterium]
MSDLNEHPDHDDPRFDAWLQQQAAQLNTPPATPRDEMWSAVSSKLAAKKRFTVSRYAWPMALAAALVLGVALDRMMVARSASAPVAASQAATSPAAQPSDPARLYRVAASATLTEAQALLVSYRHDGLAMQDPAAARKLGAWGRQVLASTRLLIDSPAGDDAELRPLLEDLELVLAQIVRLSANATDSSEVSSDRALIDRALTDNKLLPRLRTAIPAAPQGAE